MPPVWKEENETIIDRSLNGITVVGNRELSKVIDNQVEAITEKAFASADWERVEINRTRINEIQQGAFEGSKVRMGFRCIIEYERIRRDDSLCIDNKDE